jgi:hypothetical protein
MAKHIADIAGKTYEIGFPEAKKVAGKLGATRFTYDGATWIWLYRFSRWGEEAMTNTGVSHGKVLHRTNVGINCKTHNNCGDTARRSRMG